MGFFSSIGSFCKSAVSATVSVIKKTAKVVTDGVKKIGKAIASGWKSFTGENKFNEAKELLAKLHNKKAEAEASFKKDAEELNKKICQFMSKINDFREQLRQNDFDRFIELTSVFAEWNVANDFIKEIGKFKQVKMNVKLSKSELFTIDFDESPIKNNLKAIFTGGFFTRSKASQTLENVRNQESLLNEEIARLDAEKTRLNTVCKSLKEVVDYFESFHGFYGKLLNELEYTVDFVRSTYLLNNTAFFNGKLDVYFLPERHLLCLMATEKMTRVMYEMGSHKYLDDSLTLIDQEYNNSVANSKAVQELQNSLAA